MAKKKLDIYKPAEQQACDVCFVLLFPLSAKKAQDEKKKILLPILFSSHY